MSLLGHHILALTLTAITTFGLGLLVFLAEPKRRLNQIFGVYSLVISCWAVGEAVMLGTHDQLTANFWAYYIGWPSVIFIAPTFLHTVFLSTGQSGRSTRITLLAAYLASAGFLLLHLFTDLVTGTPRPVDYAPFHNSATPFGSIIPITFLIVVNMALWRLWRSYVQATGQRKTQLMYLFWGSVIGYVGGSPDWCFAFGFHIPLITPFGIYGVSCYSIATTYAVLHHKLFDVHLVIRRSLVYSILVTTLTVGYFGMVYAVERLFQTAFGYQSAWLSLAAFSMMALFFQPLKIGIQRIVDWVLFRATQEELVRRMERLEQETRRTEKLKAVATLAASMAHEIKNPLSSIKTFAEYLPQRYDEPAFREKFAYIISQEVEKINTLVHRLLEFAKPSQPNKQVTKLPTMIDETVEFLQNKLLDRHIRVTRSYSSQGEVLVDPMHMKQVFLNVLLNSIEAMERPGWINICSVTENGHLEVMVSDTGPGIAKKELTHVFDPFYTTKPHGTGLGLSVVHSIVKEHGGRVLIDSDIGRGTTVRIQLPTHGG